MTFAELGGRIGPAGVSLVKLWTALAELGIEEYAVHDEAMLGESVYPADLSAGTEFINHALTLVDGREKTPVISGAGTTLVYLGETLPEGLGHPRRGEVQVALREGWDQLRSRFDDLSRAIARLSIRQDLLMRSFSRTTNLDWFVSRVAKIVGNPCLLVNTEHKILAVSRELRTEVPNKSERLDGDYISAEAIQQLRKDRVFDRIAEAHHAIQTSNDRYDQTWAFSSLVLGSNALGHLDVLARNRPFTPSDLELIDDASELLCVVVAYGGLGGSFAGTGSSVLADLVEGGFADREALEEQLATTVIPRRRDDGVYLLLALIAGDDALLPGFRAHVAGMVSTAFSNAIWSYTRGCFVVLAALTAEECAGPADYEGAERYLASNTTFFTSTKKYGLHCAVAEPFCDLLDTPRRFQQCIALADAFVGRKDVPQNAYWWRCRYDVLAHAVEGTELEDALVDARVREMARYDRRHRTAYLRTAAASVRFPGAPTEAAASLNVHRNTYFYRTGKIYDLFNLDLKDGDDRMAIALAVHLAEAGLEL